VNIDFREPSTKRGIVMLVTGAVVLYQTLGGTGVGDIDATVARVDWWLGVGLSLAGLLGLLPDRPAAPPPLPPLELQGRATEDAADRRNGIAADQPAGDRAADQRLRVDLPAGHRAGPDWNERREDDAGWNG